MAEEDTDLYMVASVVTTICNEGLLIYDKRALQGGRINNGVRF